MHMTTQSTSPSTSYVATGAPVKKTSEKSMADTASEAASNVWSGFTGMFGSKTAPATGAILGGRRSKKSRKSRKSRKSKNARKSRKCNCTRSKKCPKCRKSRKCTCTRSKKCPKCKKTRRNR